MEIRKGANKILNRKKKKYENFINKSSENSEDEIN